MGSPLRLGLIADTHGHFDPRLPDLFRKVDHILHAGDIGTGQILATLESIAPVTAVLGNNDHGIPGLDHLEETACVEFGGTRFIVHHIVDPSHPPAPVLRNCPPGLGCIVVYGHTHVRNLDHKGAMTFVNPGYAGRPRFERVRSVVLLELEDGSPRYQTIIL